MIGKAKACVGGTSLIGYVIDQKKGYELERSNLSGQTPSELYRSMQVIQNQNLRCKNNTISIVLSPEIDDGKKLTTEQWKHLSKSAISALGVNPEDAQYISFIHTEKEHKHLHIILNRVQDDGKLVKDSYIGKRMQHIAHNLALDMNLVSAKVIKEEKQKERKELLKEFRADFRKTHDLVSETFPKDLEEYSNRMKACGYRVTPTINKQGNIQGFNIIDENDTKVKLSEVDRKIKLTPEFFELLKLEKQKAKKESESFEQKIFRSQKRNFKLKM